MKTTSVSIILTFHNSESLVDYAVNLVTAQTFTNYELIVVDDGSTDRTAELLADRVGDLPQATLIAKDINEGVAAARNSAVAVARGDYVWFLDCDDWWEPTMLDKLVAAASSTDADLAVCRAVRARSADSGRRFELDGLDHARSVDRVSAVQLMVEGRIRGYLWNKLISTPLLKANPFPKMSSLSDITGLTSVIAAADRVTFVPEMLYVHLVREGSITNSRNPALRNIEVAWRAIRSLAESSGAYADDDDALTYFDYSQYYAAVINTFYRVGADSVEARLHESEVRKAMSWRGSLTVAKYDRRLALITLLMKYLGPLYGAVYRSFRALFRR